MLELVKKKVSDYFPFWNDQCQELTSRLWLPTETDLQGLDTNSSNTLLNATGAGSWFSVNHHLAQNLNSLKTCSILSTSFPAECTDLEITKSKLVKLSVTKEQKKIFENWLNVARFVYNLTMAMLRDWDTEKLGKIPSFIGLRNYIFGYKGVSGGFLPDFTKTTPKEIKAQAVQQALDAFWATCRANKGSGKLTTFKFKSRKDAEQSVYIAKDAIKETGIYPKISGKGLGFSESLPESFCDSRLISRYGEFYLALPYKTTLSRAENQGLVVAIDPGVRTFATYFSDDSCGFIGRNDFSRIQRLCFHLDGLISRASKAGKQTKRSMLKAAAKIRKKIRNLISELHHKAALFLVTNFDTILLPTFEVNQMVGRKNRKIRSKTVRSLLSFCHYKFKLFLKNKAFEHGKTVLDVCEAYTSKTHPETGEIKNIGGAKVIKLTNGELVNRDIVGARNILLRALVDTPDCFTVAVN